MMKTPLNVDLEKVCYLVESSSLLCFLLFLSMFFIIAEYIVGRCFYNLRVVLLLTTLLNLTLLSVLSLKLNAY